MIATLLLALASPLPSISDNPVDVGTELRPMPEALEVDFALSALPPAMRSLATVYTLDVNSGYRVARRGTSGVECIVERTSWESGELRDDVFIPICFDDEGSRTLLKAKKDTAELRANGLEGEAIKKQIEEGFARGLYTAPQRPGVSYMLAPVMRTAGPPDLAVKTMVMPHVMFYAPGLSNADIGALPNLSDRRSLGYPFVDRQGHGIQTFIIQMIGSAETEQILKEEMGLIRDLCAFSSVLCVAESRADPTSSQGAN